MFWLLMFWCVLLLIEKKNCHCDPPRARERSINLSYLGIRNSIICLFAHYSERTSPFACGVLWVNVVTCQIFFFPHATGDESHTTKTQTLFSFSFGLPPSACRSITAREERTRSARDTKKGKRVVCSSRELARARLREKEREVERDDLCIFKRNFTFKNISLAL